MKFGRIIATLESEGSLLNTDKVVAISDQVQGTEQEPAPPAGLDEENITPNPDDSEAEQAADVAQVADPETDAEVVEVTQGEEQDYENPAKQLDELQQAGNEATTSSGGVLTRLEAQSIQTSVESIMGSLGMAVPSMPTLEAYTGTWSGKEAARLTMESVLDSAKEVGKKIVAGLKAILEYCMNFLTGLVKNRALMEKNVERLLVKAREMLKVNWEHRKDTVTGRFVHGLATNGQSDVKGIHSILQDSAELIICYGFSYEMLRDIRDGAVNPMASNRLADTVAVPFKVVGKATPIDENDVELRGHFAGGMSLAIVKDDRGENSVRFISNAGKTARTKDPEMEAVAPNVVIDVLEDALVTIRAIRKIEGTTNRISDAVKGILRQVEGEYYNLRGNLGADLYAQKAKANKAARDAQEIIRRMIVRFPSMAFSSVKNACDWASSQINNYRV